MADSPKLTPGAIEACARDVAILLLEADRWTTEAEILRGVVQLGWAPPVAKCAVRLLLDNGVLETKHRYYAPTIEGWTAECARVTERASATPGPPAADSYGCLRATDVLREWLASVKRAGESVPAAAGEQRHKPPAAGFCVRLSQAAGTIGRSKRTLEGWQAKDTDFPLPVVEGGGGKASEWEWAKLRPYLERKIGRPLPEHHPADLSRPDYGDVSRLEEPNTLP